MSSRLETAGVTRVIESLNGRALLLVSSGKTKGLAKKRSIKNLAVIKKFSPRLRERKKCFYYTELVIFGTFQQETQCSFCLFLTLTNNKDVINSLCHLCLLLESTHCYYI